MSDHYGSIAINDDTTVAPPQKQDRPAQKPPTPRKSFFFPLLLCCLVAVYFLTGIYLVPLALKKYLPQYIHNQSGLVLSIENAQLNPLNFQLTLKNITVEFQESSTTAPLLSIQSLFIDLDFTSLIRSSFTCDKLTIENLQLNLVRYKDKHYNIPALSRFSKTQEQGDIISFAKLPFLFSLNNINVHKSRILFEDQVTDKKHIVEELQLAIPTLSNFDFQSNNYIQPHFSAIINGSPIQLSGEAVQLTDNQGFQTKLSCSIKSLDLVPYFSYLPSTFPLTIMKGWADTTLEIHFAPDKRQGDKLTIDIKMDAVDIEMQGRNESFQIAVPAMKLDAMITPIGKQFHIKDVITKNVHISGNASQIQAVLHTLFFPIKTQGQNPPAIIIDRLLTDQSNVTLLDGTTKEHSITSDWSNLQLTIKNFDSSKATGLFQISGTHATNKGDFSWQGHFLDANTVEGKLLLNNFPTAVLLKKLLPESKDLANGNATLSGDLNFSSKKNTSVSYTLDGAILELHNLRLLHGISTWLKAGSVRFTRLSKTNDQYNLGNIFFKDATLTLDNDSLPPLLNHLITAEKRPLIRGIDFDGKLNITNRDNPKKPLQVSNIHFQANRLEQTATTENFAFSGHLPSDGIIKAKGVINFAPVTIEANLAFSNIDTQIFSPFFLKWPILFNSRTVLHGKGTYSFPASSYQGDLRFNDAILQAESKTPLITWKSAELNNISCRFSPFSLKAESLLLSAPQFQWQRSTLSPFQDFKKGIQLLTQESSEANTLFPIEIQTFNLKDASVTLVDKRLSPPWSATVNELEGRIKNFNTTEKSASTFNLTGKLEESPLTLSGAVALFGAPPEARATMKLSDLPLMTFEKQLESSPISPGKTSLRLELTMTEKASLFNSKSNIIVTNLQPSSSNSDIALALAFLTDESNSFPLNLELTDSSQSLVKESIANFQTTIIKASYAPFLLDRRFKDLQDQDIVSFQPGSNQIDANGKTILHRYAKLLEEHPGLSLTITGLADKKTDREILRKIQEGTEKQRVDTINSQGLAAYRKTQQAILATPPGNTLKEESIPKRDLDGYKPILPNPVHISDSTLLKLARERSLIAYDFFVHTLNITPQRVAIMNKPEIPDKTPSNGTRIGITTISKTIH